MKHFWHLFNQPIFGEHATWGMDPKVLPKKYL